MSELTAAVGDSTVDKIAVVAGRYEFSSSMCSSSALCINRAVIIEAEVAGSVVLDANGAHSNNRRVVEIQSSGVVALIGLNITGGYSRSPGAGLRIAGQAALEMKDCNIHHNTLDPGYWGGAGLDSWGT